MSPISLWQRDKRRVPDVEGQRKSLRSRTSKVIVACAAVTAGTLATAQLAGAGTLSDHPHQHHRTHQHHTYSQQSGSWSTRGYQPGSVSKWVLPGWPPANHDPNAAPPSGRKPSASLGLNTRTNTGTNTGPAGYSSSDRWASYSTSGYNFYNDVWGSGSGPQRLWVSSASNWGVSSTQPPTWGVKSYPDISKSVNKPLNSLSSATSSFSEYVPSGVGDWESAYDIWLNGTADEIMIWTYKNGRVGPLGSPVRTVNLDGNTWTLYAGSNGSNPTYSFVRSSNEASGTVNILHLLKYLENTMGYFSSPTLSTIQYGFEITSTNNTPQNFAIANYSTNVY
jgi:Glycosyl hydrolase family 12